MNASNCLLASALLIPLASAEPSAAQASGIPAFAEPVIEFADGEPSADEVPVGLRGFVSVVATFETPAVDESLTDSRGRRHREGPFETAIRSATDTALAKASSDEGCRVLPPGRPRPGYHVNLIYHETVRERQTGEQAIRWRVYGCDDAMVRSLTRDLARTYYDALTVRYRERRDELARSIEATEEFRVDTEGMQARLDAARRALAELGEAEVDDELAQLTLKRLFQEKRLARADVAGVQARSKAVKEGRAASGERSDLLDAMQVELEIELVGALAVRDRLSHEIELFQAVIDCKTSEADIAKRHERYDRSVRDHAVTESVLEAAVDVLNLHIIDDRVVVSPINEDTGAGEP